MTKADHPTPATALAPGDLVEIDTGAGLAYLQITHDHASYPEVLRALPGLHGSRPGDLRALAAGETAFTAMLPLAQMLAAGRLQGQRLGRFDLPDAARAFPTFRTPIRDRSGAVVYWWFWDGEGLRFDADPGPEAARFPLREVIGANELLARLRGMGAA